MPQSVQFTDDERMAVRQEIAALKGFTVRALLAKKDQQKTNEDFSEATETKATLERVSAVSLASITSKHKAMAALQVLATDPFCCDAEMLLRVTDMVSTTTGQCATKVSSAHLQCSQSSNIVPLYTETAAVSQASKAMDLQKRIVAAWDSLKSAAASAEYFEFAQLAKEQARAAAAIQFEEHSSKAHVLAAIAALEN